MLCPNCDTVQSILPTRLGAHGVLDLEGPQAHGVLDLAGPGVQGVLDHAGPRVQGVLDPIVFTHKCSQAKHWFLEGTSCRASCPGRFRSSETAKGGKPGNLPNREKRQRAGKGGRNIKKVKNAQHCVKGGSASWVVLRSPGALPRIPIFPPSIRVGPPEETR